MDAEHIDEKWAMHTVPDSQVSASRSSRLGRDSHSRAHRHHRQAGGRGSVKAKGTAHRSTRYKEKFQALREKYDRVLAIRDTIERDLYTASEKMDKIQAENDLLLDAIHTASPELMHFVSPVLAPRLLPPHLHPHPHARTQPYPTRTPNSNSPPDSHPHPHTHPHPSLYDPLPARFSPVPGTSLPNTTTERGYEHDYDYEMHHTSSGHGHARMSFQGQAVNGLPNNVDPSVSMNGNGTGGENGIVTSPMRVHNVESVPLPEDGEAPR